MKPTLYVKKICSLNPAKYKFITWETAIAKYECYLAHFEKGWKKGNEPKTFYTWLVSEI